MAGLILYKKQEIDRMRRDMDRLFSRLWDDFGVSLFPSQLKEGPTLDLSETENALILKVDVPGINPEDLAVAVSEDVLILKGEITQGVVENGLNHRRRETLHGQFSRRLPLPCRISTDGVEAVYQDGLLTVILPKSRAKEPREVKIVVK